MWAKAVGVYYCLPCSYFLFGPCGTGKSSWLAQVFPDTIRLDLLAPDALRTYQARPEGLH